MSDSFDSDIIKEQASLKAPLPEEVARLCHYLRDLSLERRTCTDAAAALERQAREIERLSNGNEELKRMCEHFNGLHEFAAGRIAELEAERDEFREGWKAHMSRADKAEADRDRAKKLAKYFGQLKVEARAIEAATIERCAKVADLFASETPHDVSRAAAHLIAEDIRALAKPAES